VTGQEGVQLDANAVAATTVAKSAAVSWPLPLDRRLDQLVDLANQAGANTRRQEMAAALIAAAVPNGEDLLRLVIGWRKRLVREVVLDVAHAAQVVNIPRYPPGRRRRTG
jgi:hypothetical protein